MIFESANIGTFVRAESACIETGLKTRFRADNGRLGLWFSWIIGLFTLIVSCQHNSPTSTSGREKIMLVSAESERSSSAVFTALNR